ncbi:predicted protein [Candida tropicalis MYA-3404]|uniref:Meiotic nuclear division protein 1 n=1 Tax=Candida tropicalis (strain ATCC MYA-3404 / T1) TaxID=294747 RepID=C5MAG9_CANTT|nr:predicted protein [Candida tropicalis MYA-3404]EER32636.1 predicted protein [Candida tropicalis MYA-3404]KAG4406461.1 hypothetical protein JTP64_003845 [Candida tropicalis]
MPPKKGPSQEEKLSTLLAWFQNTHSFYTIKEIEQKASKACKIPPMQIKELVTILVNEGLVEQEKCGTTNLFWSFQYIEHKKKLQQHDSLRQSIVKLKAEKDKLLEELQNSVSERDNFHSDRKSQIRYCNNLAEELNQLECEMKSNKQDEEMERLIQAINFFNESIESILSYLSQQSGTSVLILKNEFGIPLDLDDTPPMNSNGVNI